MSGEGTIAGHSRKIISQGWCECGVQWSTLRYVTRDCIGQPKYAHSGCLNEREYNEVIAEVEKEAARIEMAMAGLARSGA